MECEILIADPAKNITVFVLDKIEDKKQRSDISRALLAAPGLHAEQVGFVSREPWRLEMMGGEFCGNAARSFGLFAAREQGLSGKVSIPIEISGRHGSLLVELDIEEGRAETEMPIPCFETLEYQGRNLPVLVFEGITHVIAADLIASKELFYAIKNRLDTKPSSTPGSALGVMFYDTPSQFMTPAVYVEATDSLVFESSCGSGSAALGAWLSRDMGEGNARYEIKQPGGIIEVKVVKNEAKIQNLYIGGKVTLSGRMRVGVR
ncbi:diaminopimelate epimerase [Spirochaetia bacterium]|nr:diaminopimelate epimerase [Spirochaetia bacterium]